MAITINLSVADRRQIIANQQQVVLVADLDTTGGYAVVCAAFSPLSDSTVYTFLPTWQVFATPQPLVANTLVEPTVVSDAQPGYCYIFQHNGFSQGGAAYPATAFGLENQQAAVGQSIRCGISQLIQVNSVTPVAAPLTLINAPFNQTTYLQPQSDVLIFVATNMKPGLLISTELLQPAAVASLVIAPHSTAVPLTVGKYLVVPLLNDTTVSFNSTYNCFTFR